MLEIIGDVDAIQSSIGLFFSSNMSPVAQEAVKFYFFDVSVVQ